MVVNRSLLAQSLTPRPAGAFEIGGFTTALFKNGAAIGAFLPCMVGISVVPRPVRYCRAGRLRSLSCFCRHRHWPGAEHLSARRVFLAWSGVAIIAAMSNSEWRTYAALVGEFGNERDVGAESHFVS